MCEVRVARVPGAIQTVAVESGSSVADCLAAAGVEVGSNEAVKLNGANASLTATVSDNDRIVISKGAKGNS